MSLRKWLGLCTHQWVQIEKGTVRYNYGTGPSISGGPYFVYQCTLCKKLKKVEL